MNLIDTLTDPAHAWARAWTKYIAARPCVKGSASLALFEQQGRSKTGSLAQADRERLATALHFETQRLASAAMTKRPFRNAEWVKAAGFAYEPANPTKRLSEYVLAPWF